MKVLVTGGSGFLGTNLINYLTKKNGLFPIKFAEKLRKLPTPIIGRINDSTLVLDLRCLEKETDLIRQLQFLKNE